MELRDYFNVLRARKWVILQAVVIVTLTAFVASYIQPKEYQGEAHVLVQETDQASAIFGEMIPELSSQPERSLETQVQIMSLRPLAENAIRRLDLGMTPEQLLSKADVSAVGQTNIVTIKVTDTDAKRAADIANALAEEYVSWSREVKRESLKAASEEVDNRLQLAKQDILELGRKINEQGKSDELAAELQIATGAYTTLAEKLEQLRINEQLEVGSGRVVSSAVVNASPVAPKPMRNAALGFAVGLAFGLGMAFLYEYLDNTIKSTEEAEALLEAPVLGHIPGEKFDKGEKRRLTIVEKPGSPAAEAYRVLRNSLEFVNFEHDIKTLLVTSAAPGEGKSTVAANLAAAIAQAGLKVVLLTCDFRRPTTEQFFGVNNLVGLSDVLLGRNSLKSALQKPGDEQLLILTSGRMPPNPSELLGSTKMQELVRSLEEWADMVIIDTPPLLAVADPAAVARWADGVLIVTRGGSSTRDAVKKARELLEKVGAKIIGSVVWGLEPGVGGAAYGYGYGYAGYYYYADYYNSMPGGGKRKKRKGDEHDSGAKATVQVVATPTAEEAAAMYIPTESTARRLARVIGRVMAATLAFMAVVAIFLAVVYALDGYFHWGVVARMLLLLQ